MNLAQRLRLNDLATIIRVTASAHQNSNDNPEAQAGMLRHIVRLAGELQSLALESIDPEAGDIPRKARRELAHIKGNASKALRFIGQGKLVGPGDNATVCLRMIERAATRAILNAGARIDAALVAAFNNNPSDATASAIYSALAAAGYAIDYDASLVAADDTSGDLMVLDNAGEPTLTIRADGAVWEVRP